MEMFQKPFQKIVKMRKLIPQKFEVNFYAKEEESDATVSCSMVSRVGCF